MVRTIAITITLLFVALLIACDSSRFAEAARTRGKIEILEGLPHQRFEADLFAREKKRNDTVEIEGYFFYSRPLFLPGQAADEITDLLKQSDAYSTNVFSFMKHCGGFHPDFAVKYVLPGGVYTALICFGCDEARLHGPGVDALYDLSTSKQLEAILKPLGKHRPRSHLN